MASSSFLIVAVFVLQVVIHLMNTIGAATLNRVLWDLYISLPNPTSKAAREQRQLQKEFLQIRKELNATSSQDEFAKWAKLRRQHDKLMEQLEKKKSSLDANKATFTTFVTTLRWISTTGARLFLQFWYSKEPLFWLPHGWVPYYAEWLLSFPRAPLGSISIQAWQFACAAVILLVNDAIVAIIGLLVRATTRPAQKSKEEPVKLTSEKSASKASEGAGEAKKEL